MQNSNLLVRLLPWCQPVTDPIFSFIYPFTDSLMSYLSEGPSFRFRPRALLTEADAVQIYLCRPARASHSQSSKIVAQLVLNFSVSPKAIRDIWNRRTWVPETKHLWSDGECAMVRTKTSKLKPDLIARTNIKPAARSRVLTPSYDLLSRRSLPSSTFCDQLQFCEKPLLNISLSSDLASTCTSSMIFSTPVCAYHDLAQRPATTLPIPREPERSCNSTIQAIYTADIWDVTENVADDDPFHGDWAYW